MIYDWLERVVSRIRMGLRSTSGHAFNCDERASYDAESARTARERTVAFFNAI
jgi:dienelactone hydrolase